jgi:hypothetical protein
VQKYINDKNLIPKEQNCRETKAILRERNFVCSVDRVLESFYSVPDSWIIKFLELELVAGAKTGKNITRM